MDSPMRRLAVLLAVLVGCLAMAATASAQAPAAVSTFTWTPNMHPLGHSARVVPLRRRRRSTASTTPTSPSGASGPSREPMRASGSSTWPIRRTRSRSTTTTSARPARPGATRATWSSGATSWSAPGTLRRVTTTPLPTCDGETVPLGFEGLHIFSIATRADPELFGSVAAGRAAEPRHGRASTRMRPQGHIRHTAHRRRALRPDRGRGRRRRGRRRHARHGDRRLRAVHHRGGRHRPGRPRLLRLRGQGGSRPGGRRERLIVVNNVAGAPITMGGSDPAVTIPAVHVSQADGAAIRAALPATGTVSSNPEFGCGSHTALGRSGPGQRPTARLQQLVRRGRVRLLRDRRGAAGRPRQRERREAGRLDAHLPRHRSHPG